MQISKQEAGQEWDRMIREGHPVLQVCMVPPRRLVICRWRRLVTCFTLGGTRHVGGLLVVAGRLSGTVSPFRAEQGTSLETPGTSPFPMVEVGQQLQL